MSKNFSKTGLVAKGILLLAAVAFLVAAAVPASAVTLRQSGSTGVNGSGTNGAPTGNHLFTFYDIGEGDDPTTSTLINDNVLRLIDPNGCGNSGTGNGACGSETDLCAMFYVFDDDQEMGECCGCPITPNELNTYSVRDQLVNNWALATQDNSAGVIAVVGSAINDPGSPSFCITGTGRSSSVCADAYFISNGCGNVANPACNGGCDPTIAPITTGATNLDGSITHDQMVAGRNNLTETNLYDQGAGERTNNAYLVAQCAALIGNGSHANGYCYCEEEAPI